MKIKPRFIKTAALFLITNCDAGNLHGNTLTTPREQVVQQYLLDLQKADYKDIVQLFNHNGFVISTSRGTVDARDFFYAFLPNILRAKITVHQVFLNAKDSNHIAARFYFSFKLKDGESGGGEYIDEFVFSENSLKLSAVYMFENLKFTTSPTLNHVEKND